MTTRISKAELHAAIRDGMYEELELVSGEVYFLYSCDLIKIGTSNHHLRRVMREIAPYCPAPLSIIGVINYGGKVLEGKLHKRFEALWVRDEWFQLGPALRTYLCEDERRADRLEDAEDDYRDWLEDELLHQKEVRYGYSCDQPAGQGARTLSEPSCGTEFCGG